MYCMVGLRYISIHRGAFTDENVLRLIIMQVFIVAGGGWNRYTEILVEGSNEWTKLSYLLPSTAYYGFSASVSLDNKVFMIGVNI